MQRRILTSLLLTVLPFAACTSMPREASTRAVPPLYVPTTSVVQGTIPGTQTLALNPYHVLPSSDADTLFVGRADKFVYGPTVFAESTEFSIVTYDQQLISSLWGPSYRYRYITQNGITAP